MVKRILRKHGDGATIEAAMEADTMLDNGDLDAAAVWRKARR